ncbi:MAG: SPFH domain-containing protein [Anaerolineales bacterium]|nr:SPFH domain-containing protein [Anaerolineales bacterium]MCB0006659.1 SPFH domain-containing protein [Anaerolineales bacterium]MCB0011883.1 SPFH domain-containing protein [Anaerolineales bacterium]MCB8962080.1 SPFH domain-containing protein [Ardenticatenales bacterium]
MRRWLDSLGRDWQPLFVNLLLGLLFLLYWLGVYLMENIQPSREAPLFWQLFASVLFFLGPLTDIVTSLQDYMSWRVLRHFIPLAVGIYLAYMTAGELVQQLYDFPSSAAAQRFLTLPERIAAQPRGRGGRSSGRIPDQVWALMTNAIMGILFVGIGALFLLTFSIAFTGSRLGDLADNILRGRSIFAWITGWLIVTVGLTLMQELSRPKPRPPVTVRREHIPEDRAQYPVLRVGGGSVSVQPGDVVISEKNGRFFRAFSAGTHRLEKFEGIRSALDLRQQERTLHSSPFVTKDGIEIRLDLSVTFRLLLVDQDADEHQAPRPEEPFPFGPTAARRAAYTETVRNDGGIDNWEDRVIEEVVRQIRRFVAENRLDELIYPERTYPERTEHHTHDALLQAAQRARLPLRRRGVELMDVRLGRIEANEAIANQLVEYWQAFWQREEQLKRADSEARAYTAAADARIQAEAAMIRAIVDGLDQVRHRLDGSRAESRKIMALRLIESLEEVARRNRPPTARDPVMQQLSQLRGQLVAPPGRPLIPPPLITDHELMNPDEL